MIALAENDGRPALIGVIPRLCKARISAAVMVTAGGGYLLQAGRFEWGLIPALLGVYLMACGSSALNQWQERKQDALMERTRGRPLPLGEIGPGAALLVSWVMILGGALVLWLSGPPAAATLGFFTVAWYNGVYSFLKRRSAFAVVPGSLVGAIPPAIGWTCAGGQWWDRPILFYACFMFIWQAPHFWLLVMRFGKEYEAAGFPTLTSVFTPRQMRRIIWVWIVSTALAGAFLPFVGLVRHPWLVAVPMLAASAWIVFRSTCLLRGAGDAVPLTRPVFRDINIYSLAVLLLLCPARF